MKRVVFITILSVLAAELLLLGLLMLVTPLGGAVSSYISPPKVIPILTASGKPPTTAAKASYLLDADTNHTLLNINGTTKLPMASTTKIMTALIALEKASPNMVVTIKSDAVNEVKNNDGSSAGLVAGDTMKMSDLLYGLLLPSGDDASVAIADAVSGSQPQFVTLMNDYAKKLRLTGTHYVNASGLTYAVDGKPSLNTTTAADLAKLTRYALNNPRFTEIVRIQQFNATSLSGRQYSWTNTDDLLSTYPGTIGIKTGFTPEAGECLVFAATQNNHTLIGVVLGEPTTTQRFMDATTILNWGFALPLKTPPAPPSSPWWKF